MTKILNAKGIGFFLLGFLSISGCAQTLGRLNAIRQADLGENGIEWKRMSQGSLDGLPAVAPNASCIHTYVIIPDATKYDLQSAISEACPGATIRQAQLERKFFFIPFIYGSDCLEIQGRCQH